MDKKNYKPSLEINGPQFGTFVETAGYRTAKAQIESFLYAGEALKASRAGSFDTDSDEPVEDPSLFVRDMELSEVGMVMSAQQFETPKRVSKGDTETPVSPSESSEIEEDSKPSA